VGIIALAFIYPQFMVSPGALVPAHAELTAYCFACHAPLRGASAERCVTCHAVKDIGLRSTKGLPLSKPSVKNPFHQELISQDCVACHSDHQGPKLTGQSRKPFSHALLRATSRDRCESCHVAPKTGIHTEATGNCLQCHQQDRWKPATFDHDKLFLLDRNHNPTCATCHIKNDYKQYTCYGCHEHQPDGIRSKHIREGIPHLENCVKCHRSGSEGNEGGNEGGERD
jgi:hypothetical protein